MTALAGDPGSFRDPANRVYILNSATVGEPARVLRGVSQETEHHLTSLFETDFYKDLLRRGYVVPTSVVDTDDPMFKAILEDGWHSVLEHETIPFVSYPYEWSFSMLKDAALLQLRVIRDALENGWTLKDATPYNVQFRGSQPVFIDIPSFVPREDGEAWVGYRQFCSMFLFPLMIRSHLGIDHLPLLRSYLDGIPPTEAVKFFSGINKLKKGVLSHISLPARVENSIAKRERDDADAQERTGRKQSVAMVVGLVESLQRLVRGLKSEIEHSDWAQYDRTHTYQDAEHQAKAAFVERVAAACQPDQMWDIGCNTGTFSYLCDDHAGTIIAMDGDANAVEQLYLRGKQEKQKKILPLTINLGNISPNQGWAGEERKALDARKKPDLVLVLALIHHMRISANVPNTKFLAWLRSLDAEIVIEFVDRHDEMVVKLLKNKKEQYDDYQRTQFESDIEAYFSIASSEEVKGTKRILYHLLPR